MSDGAISQDEIDALLAGVQPDGLDSTGQVSSSSSAAIDKDALKTFAGNLKAPLVEKLNTMTGANFTGGEPIVEVLERDSLLVKLPEVVVAVSSDFASGLSGDHLYLLAPEFAQKLVNLVTKEENADFDEMALSCICDVVAMHTGSEVQELDKTGKLSGVSCNPGEAVNNPKAMIRIPQNKFALFSYPVSLDGKNYTLWEAIGGQAAEQISKAYGGNASQADSPSQNAPNMASLGGMGGAAGGGMPQMNMGMPNMGMQMGGMPQMQMQMQMPMGNMGMPPSGQNMGFNVPNVQNLQYPNLMGANLSGEAQNISLIMDVYMEMTVELGRTKKQIKDILGMGEGTIIELDKLAGEPVDILVNHKPIAKGEVVVIDENFGVRVTEILSPLERVSNLK